MSRRPGAHNLYHPLPHHIADAALSSSRAARRAARFAAFLLNFAAPAAFAAASAASGWARRHRGDDVVVERLHLIVVVVRGGGGLRLRLGGGGFLRVGASRRPSAPRPLSGRGRGRGRGGGGGIERQRAVRRGREARWRDRRRGRRGGYARVLSLSGRDDSLRPAARVGRGKRGQGVEGGASRTARASRSGGHRIFRRRRRRRRCRTAWARRGARARTALRETSSGPRRRMSRTWRVCFVPVALEVAAAQNPWRVTARSASRRRARQLTMSSRARFWSRQK